MESPVGSRSSWLVVVAVIAFVLAPAGAHAQKRDPQLQVAERVPEYGGAWWYGGALRIWLTTNTPDVLARAQRELVRFVGPEFETDNVRGLDARFSYLDLAKWYERLGGVWSIDGVRMTDIDERHNRLTVGVRHADLAPSVEAKVRELGIPTEAVTVEVISGAQQPLRSSEGTPWWLVPLGVGIVALVGASAVARRRRGRSGELAGASQKAEPDRVDVPSS